MKKLSRWASAHIFLARLFIVLGHVMLCLLAYLLVEQLNILGYQLPENGIYLVVVFAIPIWIWYPSGKRDQSRNVFFNAYAFRKSCDFILFMLAFIAYVFLFSHENVLMDGHQLKASSKVKDTVLYHYQRTPVILESLSRRDKHTLTRAEKKVLIKEFKFQSRKYAESKLKPANEEDDNAGKIILIILLALGLTFLLALLACSIACGGLEALAVIVGIAGLAAIIWYTVVLIRNLKQKKVEKANSNAVST